MSRAKKTKIAKKRSVMGLYRQIENALNRPGRKKRKSPQFKELDEWKRRRTEAKAMMEAFGTGLAPSMCYRRN